ncbi:glycosyltransferase family 2 protein [Dokdonia sinensis]|uniref:Glycosyltransferase family 2 protein n=1 Tax=Dokdonia sinensis TaxID=2479847 RepID=A0A3M0FY27_9FLAO|nr:glycosyltransferase family 2 protein [Dokdonia sinensis]RMB57415.1 glycosyltransferase family 2 protein [Dokdonia sinensis]
MTADNKNATLVYMPALNEATTIVEVIQSITSLENLGVLKVLVVDDGSDDNTSQLAQKAGAMIIKHQSNKGVGAAFQTAIGFAIDNDYGTFVSIDADGQFKSSEIQKLIEPIKNKLSDFVLGIRFENGRPLNMSKVKYYGNKLVNGIISKISGNKILDASCGFRAYSSEALLHLNLHGNFTYTHETILDLLDKNLVIEQVPISVTYFPDRESRVAGNILTYGKRTSRIIFKCYKDYAPFYFFFNIGLFFLFISILLGGFVLKNWIKTGSISPYKSFGIVALAFFGIFFLFLILALIGDMLSRIRRNQERMLYSLKKKMK